jgi:TolB protein
MRFRSVLCVCLAVASVCAVVVSSVAAQTQNLDGRILFVKDGDLWVLDGGGARALATGGTFSQPSWAPDGSGLAYVYRGTNFADIFVTDDQGQNQKRLTNSQSTVLDNNDWNFRPAWSPDGTLIAYVSDRSSTFPVLWLMSAIDGSGRHAIATPGLQQEAADAIAWSPDGSQLAVTVFNEPGPTQIALVPTTATGRPLGRVLTDLPAGALDPAWAPDGSWLAFAGHDGYAVETYVARPDGTSVTKLTSDGLLARSPTWSLDGRHIAYLSNKTGYFEVWMVDVQVDETGALAASNPPRQLTHDLHVDATSGLSWGH